MLRTKYADEGASLNTNPCLGYSLTIFASCKVVIAPHSRCEVISLASTVKPVIQFSNFAVVLGWPPQIYELMTGSWYCLTRRSRAGRKAVPYQFCRVVLTSGGSTRLAVTNQHRIFGAIVNPRQSPVGIYHRPRIIHFIIASTTGNLRWLIAFESLCRRNRCGLY